MKASPPPMTVASAIAILVTAAEAPRFAASIRLHDHAVFELNELAKQDLLGLDTHSWRFVPSPNGGYALVGLADALLILSEESWLRRDPVAKDYIVSQELHEWGSRELAGLSVEERKRVRQVALRWKARASVSSKKVA